MHTTKRSKLKFIIIGAVFVLVVAALILLCARCAKLGSNSQSSATPVTTEISGQDASGKDVTSKLTMTSSDEVPDGIDKDTSDLVLMDISWNSKKDANFPLLLTIQDPALVNNDGVSVYHYTNNAWELIGTYLIQNNSVSFQVTSLSPFALLVINSNATASPSPSPSSSPSPSPTPTTTPTATPTTTPTATANPTTSPTKKPTSTSSSTKTTSKPTTKPATATPVPATPTPESKSTGTPSDTNPTNPPATPSKDSCSDTVLGS